ncbi:MAG: ATP-binding cassette domain-containing protein [Deltaproteobacteria bacterium]|nr:ATP-binding cassette domain-containing protein [Deltaproteobacteria bacterium]
MLYGSRTALDGLDWEIFPGQHWAVLGRNGAGKSSLLRLLRGEVRPSRLPSGAGEHIPAITWNFTGEEDTSPLAVRPVSSILSPELQRHYVRQGWRLRGEEVILSGFSDAYMPYSPPSPEEREMARDMASRLGAAPLLDVLAPDLSQGQLRLLLLARALVKKPRLLLLDEPCDGLDHSSRKHMFALLEECSTASTTIICALHRDEDAPSCLTHALELESGRIVRSFRLEPDTGRRPYLSQARENSAPAAKTPPPPPAGRPIFRLRRGDVYIKRKLVLRGIDWEVRAGEQWLLSGANGSGKTTLLRVILGEEHVALGGSLTWFGPGLSATKRLTLEERRNYTGHVSDRLRNDYRYDLTGLELVLSGLHNSIGLYRASTEEELKKADFWLKLLELEELADERLEKMSEGLSRRFLLARALAPRPRLLILDEPCSGLDADSRESFLSSLPKVMDQGCQLIFVSHSPGDLAEIAPLLTHELALENGRVIYRGGIRTREPAKAASSIFTTKEKSHADRKIAG